MDAVKGEGNYYYNYLVVQEKNERTEDSTTNKEKKVTSDVLYR